MASEIDIRLRIRNVLDGSSHVITNRIKSTSTLHDLKSVIFEVTKIPIDQQKLKAGYPPKELTPSNKTKIADIPLKSGELILVESVSAKQATHSESSANNYPGIAALQSANKNPAEIKPVSSIEPSTVVTHAQPPVTDGVLIRRYMDDDNSCLFSAIGYVLENHDRKKASEIRKIVASAIEKDTIKFNEAILGKKPSEYIRWIKDPKSWGGAIELSILADYYQTRITAVDTQTLRKYVFGEENFHEQFVYLVYDGLHYDCYAMTPEHDYPEEYDKTIFTNADDLELVESMVLSLTEEAKKVV